MNKSIFYIGIASVVLLSITLFFVGNMTGNVVFQGLQQNYLGLSFFILVLLGVALIEVVVYYRKGMQRELDIKMLIQESIESEYF